MADFDPKPYMMKLQGKDYLPVAPRMLWFSLEHDQFEMKILDKIIDLDRGFAYFEVQVTDSHGRIAVGVGSETFNDFPQGHHEKAFTKAYGRALAALGYGTLQAPELDEGDRVVDAPMRPPQTITTPSPRSYPPRASASPKAYSSKNNGPIPAIDPRDEGSDITDAVPELDAADVAAIDRFVTESEAPSVPAITEAQIKAIHTMQGLVSRKGLKGKDAFDSDAGILEKFQAAQLDALTSEQGAAVINRLTAVVNGRA